MATPNDGRSMTDEFRQGCIDRTYIQLAPDVGGIVEMDHRVDRAINTAPFQYLNAEIMGRDPFDVARAHRPGTDIEPYSAYLPRRDVVDRPLPDKGLAPPSDGWVLMAGKSPAKKEAKKPAKDDKFGGKRAPAFGSKDAKEKK